MAGNMAYVSSEQVTYLAMADKAVTPLCSAHYCGFCTGHYTKVRSIKTGEIQSTLYSNIQDASIQISSLLPIHGGYSLRLLYLRALTGRPLVCLLK
jgi:hypothetical protein